MEQEFYERKVHYYHDNTGKTYGPDKKPFANTLCKMNSKVPTSHITKSAEKVTCKICRKDRRFALVEVYLHNGAKFSEDDLQEALKSREQENLHIAKSLRNAARGEGPAAQFEVRLSEMSNDLAEMEALVELYRQRTERLERTLGFALDLLADNRDAVVHVPTMLSAGELIEAILADKVKEQAI